MKFAFPFIFSINCLLACHQALAADKLYKWVDDKGVTHYSEHPQLNQTNEMIKPKTGHSDPVSYATTSTAKAGDDKATTSAVKDPDRCAAGHKNQEILKGYSHIKIKGDDGEYRYLTPDEQQQKLDEASKAIAESCN